MSVRKTKRWGAILIQKKSIGHILSKIERKELVRISLKEAVEKILEEVRPLDAWEELPLLELSGRTLWEDVYSRHAQPPFPRSPLDGYAIRSQDSTGAMIHTESFCM